MSLMLASIQNDPSEASGTTLRREMVERAERAYGRSLRLRRLLIAAGLAFSLVQTAITIACPATSDIALSGAVAWGVPLLASLLALSLVWSCRLHLEQSQNQYAAYLRQTARAG